MVRTTIGGALGVLLLGAIAIDTRGFAPSLLGTKYNGRDLTLTLTLALTPTLTLARYNGRDLAAGRKLLAALGADPLPASLDLAVELDVAVMTRDP